MKLLLQVNDIFLSFVVWHDVSKILVNLIIPSELKCHALIATVTHR